MTDEILYLNGRYLPLAEGRVQVEDRGFLFGDGIYEVVRCYGGRLFRLPEHLARLRVSADAIELALPATDGELTEMCATLLDRSDLAECTIYIQATRGPAPRGHAFPKSAVPTLLAFARRAAPPSPAQRAAGVAAAAVPDDRWGRCHIKSLNLLANVLAREAALRAGAYEGLFVRDDGTVTEGTASNVFGVKGRTVFTHPADRRILHGVTRAAVLETARAAGLEVREERRALADFAAADEVFLSGTTIEILGVASLDGRPVGSGRPGPATLALQEAFVRLTRG